MSEAIKDFGDSGGVYLGLSAMAEFLKVPVPMQATVWVLGFDPVALFSVCHILSPIIPVGRNRLEDARSGNKAACLRCFSPDSLFLDLMLIHLQMRLSSECCPAAARIFALLYRLRPSR